MKKQALAKATSRTCASQFSPSPLPSWSSGIPCWWPDHKLLAQAPAEAKKLLTDRAAYIAYLESQLERVSAACLTVQSFDERLESVTSSTHLVQEKVRL